MAATNGIWQEFLDVIRQEVGSRVVETWFKAISLQEWDPFNKVVYLEVPNIFVKDWIQNRYLPLFQVHLGRLFHVDSPKIIFVDAQSTKKDSPSSIREVTVVPISQPINAIKQPVVRNTPFIYSNYTFESFVVGPSNSLAYAAAHAVTEKLGYLYNPLFIYGGSGLGKTHLLHAIGNKIKETNQDAVVLYQPADRFVNEFINAIRFDKVHKFKAKYQSVDVLLVDDVQFISNKEQTQEAFFHIFNSLYEAHKQIVFSSDTFPLDIEGIAERLSSRLASGLVTDIHMPSIEIKIAIVKKKVALHNEEMSDEVAHFIASQAVSNIRELEGALVRVMAFSSLTKQKITMELAHKVLQRTPPSIVSQKTVGFNAIIASINRHYNYTLDDLRSKSRHKDIVFVRHIAMFLMKKLTDKSLRCIGDFLGGRDHATVLHAIERVKESLAQEADVRQAVYALEKDIIT